MQDLLPLDDPSAHGLQLRVPMDGIPPAPRVVPHTGTTFDTSANGLLNTSAADSPQAVQSDHHYQRECRLLQAEVDYMVQKAESLC